MRLGRAWLDIDLAWRWYVEAYRNERTVVVTLGPLGVMAGYADPVVEG